MNLPSWPAECFIILSNSSKLPHCATSRCPRAPVRFPRATINRRQIHSPVDFLGTAMLNTASRATRNVIVFPSFPSPMNMGSRSTSETRRSGRFPTVLLSSSALGAKFTPAPEKQMRHLVLDSLLLAWLTRIMFAHCVPAPKLLHPPSTIALTGASGLLTSSSKKKHGALHAFSA